jgi:hypothetical protein
MGTSEPKPPRPLSTLVADFVTELAHANRSRHTCRAYAADLAQFSTFYRGPVEAITTDVICGFEASLAQLRPASSGGGRTSSSFDTLPEAGTMPVYPPTGCWRSVSRPRGDCR